MTAARDTELKISSLGSGSNGNAFLIQFGDKNLLLDAGVPIRTMLACLRTLGVDRSEVHGVLLSHEHSDHVRALPSLLRRNPIPVFGTSGTLSTIEHSHCHEFQSRQTFELFNMSISSFPVAHDARQPVGFFVQAGEVSIVIATDLGEVDDQTAEFVSRADHVIIESNYDEQMLRVGPYPEYLKQRIRSSTGHLSNNDCADFLRQVIGLNTGSVWLAHLSEKNNAPDVAVETTIGRLTSSGHTCEVRALPRYDGRVVTWHSSERMSPIRQSSLPF